MHLKTHGHVARQSPDSQTDESFFFHLFKTSLNILMATAVVVTVPVSCYEIPLFIFYRSPLGPGFEIVLFMYAHILVYARVHQREYQILPDV